MALRRRRDVVDMIPAPPAPSARATIAGMFFDRRHAAGAALVLTAGAPACWSDDPPAPAGGGSSGAAAALTVAACPTPSMLALYPGPWPPDLQGPRPPATTCVAAEHDAVIVLGCPNDPDGTPSTCQKTRAELAVSLMAAGFGHRFITSGGAVHNAHVEADTLRDLLVARGVPPASIFTDERAQHTDENLYYASAIMIAQGFTSALVVSDDPGHLLLTALCDSSCCVDLGRLTLYEFPVAGGQTVLAGHYALYPFTPAVSGAECAQIEIPTKFMCVNLPGRRACRDRFKLSP